MIEFSETMFEVESSEVWNPSLDAASIACSRLPVNISSGQLMASPADLPCFCPPSPH